MSSPIKAQMPTHWMSDSTCLSCSSCGTAFGILNRKHHCRRCGRIFCHSCSCFNTLIPSYVDSVLDKDKSNARVCENCYNHCQKTIDLDDLIRIFSKVPLAMCDMLQCISVSKDWCHASKVVVSVYRGIQFKSSYQPWTSLERDIIRSRWSCFAGHSRWVVQCIRCLTKNDSSMLFRNREYSCKDLLCSKICKPYMSITDIFELLCTFPSLHIIRKESSLLRCILEKINPRDISMLVPHILHAHTPSKAIFIKEVFIPICARDIHSAFAFYFECNVVGLNGFQEELWQHLDTDIKRGIQSVLSLIQYIEGILTPGYKQTSPFTRYDGIPMPYDPSIIIYSVGKPVQLSSASKPYIVPMDTNYGRKNILIKTEDIRKDRFAIMIGEMISRLTELNCITYPIFVTETGGWIEMISNAKTLYQLKNEHQTIQNWILSTNQYRIVNDIRNDFSASCVGACILSYILGVGDRHMENILVTSDGKVLHIDFSYILGSDPKFSNAEMRITPEMVDMMGGTDSIHYLYFKNYISNSYQKIRRYTHFFYTAMRYLATLPGISLDNVESHIKNRLLPGELDEEAELNIVQIMERSSGSWRDKFSDISHMVFQMEL